MRAVQTATWRVAQTWSQPSVLHAESHRYGGFCTTRSELVNITIPRSGLKGSLFFF